MIGRFGKATTLFAAAACATGAMATGTEQAQTEQQKCAGKKTETKDVAGQPTYSYVTKQSVLEKLPKASDSGEEYLCHKDWCPEGQHLKQDCLRQSDRTLRDLTEFSGDAAANMEKRCGAQHENICQSCPVGTWRFVGNSQCTQSQAVSKQLSQLRIIRDKTHKTYAQVWENLHMTPQFNWVHFGVNVFTGVCAIVILVLVVLIYRKLHEHFPSTLAQYKRMMQHPQVGGSLPRHSAPSVPQQGGPQGVWRWQHAANAAKQQQQQVGYAYQGTPQGYGQQQRKSKVGGSPAKHRKSAAAVQRKSQWAQQQQQMQQVFP